MRGGLFCVVLGFAAQPVTLRATLTGPYSSVNALKQAVSQHQVGSGIRVIEGSPLKTTDRAGGNPATELILPADLRPGYYNLATEVASGGMVASAATVVTIGI